MPQPIRSIRLEKRSTKSLNVLSGSIGEIFYDSENSALRLYTGSAGTNVTLADQAWVTENFANASQSFSGAYSDLTGTPAAITNVSELTNDAEYITLGDVDIDISSINSIGDVDTVTSAPTTGQLLQWDGNNWANATVAGLEDTNTTYALSGVTAGIGVDLKITDDDGNEFAVNIRGGAGITPSITSTNEITISNSSAITNLTDATVINPAEGHILKYTSGVWVNTAPAVIDGVELSDFSVTSEVANAGGNLTYDDTSGSFTFTPADLSGAISLTDISVSQAAASGGGTLAYDNASGAFTFSPANLSTYAQTSSLPTSITELGVTDGTNGQVLTTDGSGNFTFSSAGGGASYDQDLNTTDSVVFAAVSADTFSNASAGAPTVTSATTITLDAPDGVIITGGTFRLPSFTTTQKNALTAANGDIIYDSTASQAQVYEGSWTSISGGGIASVVADTTPQLGGNLDTNNKNIVFGDSSGTAVNRLKFGAGSDLEIYHNTTNSIIQTTNTHSFKLMGGSNNYIVATPANAVTLYHNGLQKIATSSTGISVTGTVAATALTGDGSGLTSLPAQTFASLTSKPTTLAGYGITDGLSAGATPLLSEVSSTINGATGTVVHNTTTGGVFYHTAPATNFIANFTNVPTTNDRITTVALIIAQGVTQYMPTVVEINNATQTIEWFGGSVPGGTANGFDIVSFTLIRQSSTWTVLGASSTYG